MTQRILPILLLLAATAQGAFVTKARWAARGVKNIVIDVVEGKPRWRAKVWTVPVEKDFPGAWPGTHRALAKGREFDLPNGRKLRWETSDSLAPFETKPGELKHLAEWGAHITSIVFAAAPHGGFTIAHKLSLGVGTVLAYQPELTPEEIAEGCVRPRAVVGSYSVTDKDGCKFMHIPCPVLVDAAGTKRWGTIKINPPVGPPTGVFNSVVQFKAADFAGLVYPVRGYGFDTFGWTNAGGTGVSSGSECIHVYGTISPASDGNATSVTLKLTANGDQLTLGFYADGGAAKPTGSPVGDTAGATPTITASDHTQNLDGPTAVLSATLYWLCMHCATDVTHYYDASTGTMRYNGGGGYTHGTLPDVTAYVWNTRTNRDYRVWATYTPASAAGLKAPIIGGGIL